MIPFNQSESGYTPTAKSLVFASVTTTTTAGSTTTVVNVLSTTGFNDGDTVMINEEERVIDSHTSNTVTLTVALSSAPASGVVVALAYLYDVDTIDNPPRRKSNYGLVSANIRNAREFKAL